MDFTLEGDRPTSVTIRPLTEDEKRDHKGGGHFCLAVVEDEPSPGIRAILERLARNLMFEGFTKPRPTSEEPIALDDYIDDEGGIKGDYVPPVALFSEDFQTFKLQIHHRLAEDTRRVTKAIRWRTGFKGNHNPVRYKLGVSWSFDGTDWRAMPYGPYYFFGGEIRFFLPISAELRGDLENIIKTSPGEPLGHDLFLEAWQQLATNPRSALIIGIAAAEVGFKQCIGQLVPDAEWLANNVPSPPLRNMISEYLPSLPAKLKIEGQVLTPPKRVRTQLNKGVEARNKTTHVGSAPPNTKDLEELLLSVRDFLYLLDVYSGYGWAIDRIRDEVKEAMIAEFGLTRPINVG